MPLPYPPGQPFPAPQQPQPALPPAAMAPPAGVQRPSARAPQGPRVWSFAPQYRLFIRQSSGKVWSLRTLQTAQGFLTVSQGAPTLDVVLADTTRYITRTVRPAAMNLIQLQLCNRHGQWQTAWSGYIDTVTRRFDPQQGNMVEIRATGFLKLFEITTQTPGDVAGLAVAYGRNVTGSAVLQYAARACRYPTQMLRIHPLADVASGFQQVNGAQFTSPTQASWAATMAQLQTQAGLEWFFDERGYLYWRQLGFLLPWVGNDAWRPDPVKRNGGLALVPRQIAAADIIQADFSEGDEGVVTDVEVRFYGNGQITGNTAGHWSAPPAMRTHLLTRLLVIYAPWISGKDAANFLAEMIGLQYAAGVATANMTIPADPTIGVGTLVEVPALGLDGTTVYYVSSVTYQLAWGGQWVMTLGLNYGRAGGTSFPYLGSLSVPAITSAAAAANAPGQMVTSATVSAFDPTNPNWDLGGHAVVAAPTAGLKAGQVATDLYPPGTVIQVYSAPRSGGRLLGPSGNGEYTVVARDVAHNQPSGTLGLAALGSLTTGTLGYVTVQSYGDGTGSDGSQADPSTSYSVQSQGVGSTQGTAGHPTATGGAGAPVSISDGSNIGLKALAAAKALKSQLGFVPYTPGHAGPGAWDCSGLVSWAFAQVGYARFLTQPNTWSNGDYGDSGPNGLYDYWHGQRGAPQIDVSQAQQGDLLFIRIPGMAAQEGFVHACWSDGGDNNFGADNSGVGTTTMPNAGFTSDWPGQPQTAINVCLSMAGIS